MDAIKVNGLSVRRGGVLVIENISFAVKKGSFTVLSGPSGCGKSTILKVLQGLLKNDSENEVTGEIEISGYSQNFSKGNSFSHCGYLMQNVEAQIINQRVVDEMVFNLENQGSTITEMDAALNRYSDFVALPLERELATLSGGQKQRVLIASCLCTGHDVLLLDEPLANLDIPSVMDLISTLKQLTRSGITVLMIEHRLEAIEDIADEVIWLENSNLSFFEGRDEISAFVRTRQRIFNLLPTWESLGEGNVLAIENLCANREKTPVLSEFSINLAPESCTVLTEKNGSGKTTLMRVICGLSKYSEFSCNNFTYDGVSIKSRTRYKALRKKVGFVFQNPCHQLFMDSIHNELGLRCLDEDFVSKIADLFGISHLMNRHPYSLSQGEQRLVTVAAVACGRPKLLLLDEPTIGQDYISLARMVNGLYDLQRKFGIAYLISTHDKLAAKSFGGRVLSFDAKHIKVVKD